MTNSVRKDLVGLNLCRDCRTAPGDDVDRQFEQRLANTENVEQFLSHLLRKLFLAWQHVESPLPQLWLTTTAREYYPKFGFWDRLPDKIGGDLVRVGESLVVG